MGWITAADFAAIDARVLQDGLAEVAGSGRNAASTGKETFHSLQILRTAS
jgi:hypothetical protein